MAILVSSCHQDGHMNQKSFFGRSPYPALADPLFSTTRRLPCRLPMTSRDHEAQRPTPPFTHLKIGGPAEFLIQPRNVDELRAVLTACQNKDVPVRMLGGGNNLLIRDDPIPGAVVRLTNAAFTSIEWDGSASPRRAAGRSSS